MKISPNVITLYLAIPMTLVIGGMAIAEGLKAVWSPSPTILLEFGANFAPYTLAIDQYWRILSSGFVHRGIIHLGLNIWALFVLVPMLCPLVGAPRCVLVFFLSVIAGSLASMFWDPTLISCGSSGGIFGMLGCFVACSVAMKKLGMEESKDFSGLRAIAIVSYCVLLGMLTPGTDNANHLGGLAVGSLLGIGFALTNKKLTASPRLCVVLCSILLLGALSWEKFTLGSSQTILSLVKEQQALELASKQRYLEAVRLLDAAIDSNPTDVSLYSVRIPVMMKLRLFGKAVSDCNRVIAENGADVVTLLSRSTAYHNLGEEQKAVDDLSELIKLDPKQALAYNNMAWMRTSLGQYDLALVDVNKALSLNRNLATAHDTKAVILTRMKRYDEALEQANHAAALNNSDGAAYDHRAVILAAIGQQAQASADKQTALKLGYKPEAWEAEWRP